MVRNKITVLFIAMSLSVSFFYTARQWALYNPHNSITLFAFTGMVGGVHSEHFKELGLPWKPRIGALWMTAELLTLEKPKSVESYQDVFGAYNTVWFFGSLLLLIVFLRDSLFPVIATFAGTMYAVTVTTYNTFFDDVHILPWDFPAMFFFTLSFLFWTRKQYGWMLLAIVLGTLFKESVALTAVLLFFTDKPLKRQLRDFSIAFAGCLIVHLVVTHYVLGSPTVLTAGHSAFGSLWSSAKRMWVWETCPHLNSIIWCDGGMMLTVFFFKPNTAEERGIVIVLALFAACLTITPIIDKSCYEARHWTDCLPMLAIYFQKKFPNEL